MAFPAHARQPEEYVHRLSEDLRLALEDYSNGIKAASAPLYISTF